MRALRLSTALALIAVAGRAQAVEDWLSPHLPSLDAASSPAFEAPVRRVTEGYTVRALVGPSQTPLPLELTNFLLDRPDLAAYLVKKKGIAPYRIEMLGPRRSSADDGDGTRGVVDLVAREETRRLYYGEGEHDSPLFPKLRADSVIVLTLEPRQGPDCRASTRTTFHVYVRLRSRFLSGMVKLLKPFVRDTVIRKFTKAFSVAEQTGRLMAADPAGMGADALSYGGLDAAERAALAAMLGRLAKPPSCPKRPGAAAEFQ